MNCIYCADWKYPYLLTYLLTSFFGRGNASPSATNVVLVVLVGVGVGALKMTDMKMQEMKFDGPICRAFAGHEIAGHENDGPLGPSCKE